MKRSYDSLFPPTMIAREDVERVRQSEQNLRAERRLVETERRRVEAEVQRLTAESQRLQASVERLDESIAQLHDQGKVAHQSYLTQSLAQDCKKIRLNDPHFTTVEGLYPPGYGKPLGEALQGNVQVTNLNLTLNELLTGEEETENIDALLRYIQASRNLHHVTLDGSNFARSPYTELQLVGQFLRAIQHNPCIESFNAKCEVPALTLCCLLNANNIQDLTLQCIEWDDRTNEERQWVAMAFSKAPSLQSLSLPFDGATALILHQMKETDGSSIRTELQTLKLVEYNPLDAMQAQTIWDMLSQYLHVAPMLQHLGLCGFGLNRVVAEHCVAALQHLGHLNKMTRKQRTKLTLDACHLDDEAVDVLVLFLQETEYNFNATAVIQSATGSRPTASLSPLELCLKNSTSWQDRASSIVAMIQRRPSHSNQVLFVLPGTTTTRDVYSPAAFSRLHTLTLDPSAVADFFTTLTGKIDSVHLYALKLSELDSYQCHQLAESMPSWLSIRELTLPMVPDSQCRRLIVESLRTNGSLYKVTIVNPGGLNPAVLIRIESFCQRNKCFDQQENGSLKSRPRKQAKHGTLPAHPSVLQVAQQAPEVMVSRLIGSLSRLARKEYSVGEAKSFVS